MEACPVASRVSAHEHAECVARTYAFAFDDARCDGFICRSETVRMLDRHDRLSCHDAGERNNSIAGGTHCLIVAARKVDAAVPRQPIVFGWGERSDDLGSRIERPPEVARPGGCSRGTRKCCCEKNGCREKKAAKCHGHSVPSSAGNFGVRDRSVE